MKIKETRLLSSFNLRNLCIKRNWYTKGDNNEYSHLLNELNHDGRENITTEDIRMIAEDIIEHSVIDSQMDITDVMWEIAHVCNTVFVMEA